MPAIIPGVDLGVSSSSGPITVTLQSEQKDILVDSVGDYIYVGIAAPGSAVSSAVWAIKRLYDPATGDLELRWASSSTDEIHVWDNRLSYTYL